MCIKTGAAYSVGVLAIWEGAIKSRFVFLL